MAAPALKQQRERQEAPHIDPVADFPLIHRDVRSKRPPGAELRAAPGHPAPRAAGGPAGRLDVLGVFLAIFTAIAFKAAVRGSLDLGVAFHGTKDVVALATLVTLLLFAKSGLYADRAQRPGLPRIVGSLFQVMAVILVFAIVEGYEFLQLLRLLRFAGLRDRLHRAVPGGYDATSGVILRAAGYQRRAPSSSAPAATSRPSPARSPTRRTRRSTSSASSRSRRGPITASSRSGRSTTSAGSSSSHRVDEVILADPDFPERQAVELVDEAHQHGVRVRIAPTPMELLVHRGEFVPGESVPLFELKPPVFEGIDFALKRTFDLVVAGLPDARALAGAARLLDRLAGDVAGRGDLPVRSARHRRGAVRLPEVPHHVRRRRTPPARAGGAQRGRRRDLQDPPRPRGSRRSAASCAAGRSTSCRSSSTCSRARCRSSARGPLPQRDYARLEDFHKKRYHVLPGMTGLWQVSGRSELDFDDLVRLDFLYLERWSVFLDLSILLKDRPRRPRTSRRLLVIGCAALAGCGGGVSDRDAHDVKPLRGGDRFVARVGAVRAAAGRGATRGPSRGRSTR